MALTPGGRPGSRLSLIKGADSLQLLVDVGLRDSAWLAAFEWLVVIGGVAWPVVSGPVRVAWKISCGISPSVMAPLGRRCDPLGRV